MRRTTVHLTFKHMKGRTALHFKRGRSCLFIRKKIKKKKGQNASFGQREERKKRRKKERRRREGFLLVLSRKFAIYEDPTIGSSIRFRKRDPCTWIYVLTDCFKVKH
jgi:hypothetical protein